MSEQLVDPFARHALNELLNPTGHFSICKFDDICRLMNVIPLPGHRDRLNLVHCTKYRDMDLDLRQEVGRIIYETMHSGGFDIQIQTQKSIGRTNVRSITGQSDADKST